MSTSMRQKYKKSQRILEMIDSEEVFSKTSLTLLWAYLFDRIHQAVTDNDYETLIALSQKLSTTTGNLHSIYLKLKEKQTLAESYQLSELSSEKLEEIENKLKLL